MITVSNLSLSFDGSDLFKDVNLKFVKGNCYGVIGANGAGKSTFLKILSGELEQTKGEVIIPPKVRMSVLKQDHFAFDEFSVLDTIIQGNMKLYEIMKEKEVLYSKTDFSESDGERAAYLEGEFAELDGWNIDNNASKLIQGLGLSADLLYEPMVNLAQKQKVKVMLAQSLFGNPDLVLLDEPTNGLDEEATEWLENFLIDFDGTVIVVSHDRHFLNMVCTHMVDIDYNKIRMYVGNYEFWYESSQLMERLLKEQNKKKEDKIKSLESFIERFSANKSKAKQATSRRKLIEKLSFEEMPASSRRYPFVGFKADREVGKDILEVNGITKSIDGVKILDNITFTVNKDEKIAFYGENEIANTVLFKILTGELTADSGTFKWGVTTSQSYLPADNSEFFTENMGELNIIKWLEQYSKDTNETYLRSFLGRMLFSNDDVFKKVKVLSGGEKVRLMLSKMMMYGSNTLILDQPTNHLDLESITALNNGLIAFPSVILFSSHDHEFSETVANRVIEIKKDGSFIDKSMSYEEYLTFRKTHK